MLKKSRRKNIYKKKCVPAYLKLPEHSYFFIWSNQIGAMEATYLWPEVDQNSIAWGKQLSETRESG